MGISKRNPRGNFNWQSRILKKKAICCGQLNETYDCQDFGPVLKFTGTLFCVFKPVPVSHTMTVTNTQPGQEATTTYEWYLNGVLVHTGVGPIDSYTVSGVPANAGIYTIVATNDLGCVTTQDFEVYGAETCVIKGGVVNQPSIFYSEYDSPPYVSNGSVAVQILDSDPLATGFIYRITGQSYMVLDGTTIDIPSTNFAEVFDDLPNGWYTMQVIQIFDINGQMVEGCPSNLLTVALGPLEMVFDDIANAPVADPTSVINWNTFFNVSTFDTVSVIGNTVRLYRNITGPNRFSFVGFGVNDYIVEFNDYGTFIGYISDNGFYLSSDLTTVRLNAVVTMGENTFSQCPLLDYFEGYNVYQIGSIVTTSGCFYNSGTINNVLVLSFPECWLVGRSGLAGAGCVTIDLPSCEYANSGAFSNCSALTTVNLPVFINGPSGPFFTAYGQDLFKDCVLLVSIYLPELYWIERGMFAGCTSLQSVDVPKANSIIRPNSAPGVANFLNCTSLNYLNAPCCGNIGQGCANQFVFQGVVTGGAITVNVNTIMASCNGGLGDGDLQQLVTNNPGTVINYVNCI